MTHPDPYLEAAAHRVVTSTMSVATKTEPGANKVDTGLTDSTHGSASSSASAERYRLDEFDESPILLYRYRGGLQTSSQKDLCSWLDKGG